MKGLNKIMLIGNLGADPEMRYTGEGVPVTTFRLACTRSWKDRDGGLREETEWVRIVAWDRLAEICNTYLTRGDRVYVEGRLQTRKWTDRDGQERYTTEVVAQEMIMLSAPPARAPVDDSVAAVQIHNQPQPIEEEEAGDEDIPF